MRPFFATLLHMREIDAYVTLGRWAGASILFGVLLEWLCRPAAFWGGITAGAALALWMTHADIRDRLRGAP